MRFLLRSKIHKAHVTEANLNYIDSVTIDENLIDRAGFLIGEKVMVVSSTTGERLETYVIAGTRDSGKICMNGAAAHKIKIGEEVIIMGFELADEEITLTNILVDRQNKFSRIL